MSGWYRLAVLVSLLWFCAIVSYAGYEYRAVVRGDTPSVGFAGLRNEQTGEDFGLLSRNEIKEFAELTLERSRSSSAKPGDAEEAQRLLSADPKPYLRYADLLQWIFFPIASFWGLFFGIRWVSVGFRNDA